MPEEELNHESNEILLEKVVQQAKRRGVKVEDYCLRVNYSRSRGGLGHVIDESRLEPQCIYISQAAWLEAETLGLPIEEVLEVALDHELIHEVHRSRARRKLAYPFSTDPLESITHGVMQRPEYIESKRKRLSPKTIEWLQRKNQGAREVHFTPMEQLSRMDNPLASVYQKIVNLINQEVNDNEYLEPPGIYSE